MSRPEIVIVAAVALNRIIGAGNKLPWHIPEDLKRFKKLTVGHPVVMGRKTFESILARNGAPLPGRRNIVLSRSRSYPELSSVATYASFEAALQALKREERVAIIGGASVYEAAFAVADRLELTIVEQRPAGDAYFPEYESRLAEDFECIRQEQHAGFRFESYRRVR